MSKGSKPPPAPDYVGAAAKQGESSVQAAIANYLLNQSNQSNPYGSRTTTQTGSASVPGVGGSPGYDVPTFSTQTNLTPEGQQIFDIDTQLRLGMGQAGKTALGNVQNAISSPLDISGADTNRNAVTDALYRRSTAMLDPQFDLDQRRLDTDLINRGFTQGDEGYVKAQERQDLKRQNAYGDARDRAIAGGLPERQQQINEILLQRQQPLSELSSLRSGAAPQLPSFGATPSQNIQPGNFANAAQQSGQYAGDVYNAQVGQDNAMLSGLFGLGAATAPWWASSGISVPAAVTMGMVGSDRRLKSNIVRVGTHPLGIGIYEYDIFGYRTVGVMADEVEKVMPEAVVTAPSGYKMVNYRAIYA